VTPGRWLSIEVKRLARDRRAAGVVRISAARADLERPLRSRPHSAMTCTLPAGSRSDRGAYPSEVAAHQRPSGRSQSTRIDRSTSTSPTPTRSRTQIRPGHPRRRSTPRPPQPLATTPLDAGPSSDKSSCRARHPRQGEIGTLPQALLPRRGAGRTPRDAISLQGFCHGSALIFASAIAPLTSRFARMPGFPRRSPRNRVL
jgi:hypothetical protein